MITRVSVTDVDAYRYYLDSESMELETILRRLRHEEEPTPAMRAGRALHKLLEGAPQMAPALEDVEIDGVRFLFDIDVEIRVGPFRELKLEREYVVDGVPLTVVGKVDAIDGLTVTDHKTTGRFEAERLAGSMQWRAYLDLTGASRFRWNVFEMRHQKREDAWRVYGFHQVEQCQYPGLGADWRRALADYVRFAREHLVEAAA